MAAGTVMSVDSSIQPPSYGVNIGGIAPDSIRYYLLVSILSVMRHSVKLWCHKVLSNNIQAYLCYAQTARVEGTTSVHDAMPQQDTKMTEAADILL